MNDMNENAKVDWMKIVKKHKKRQKGLPALSTLNTNAGNVEKNIELFNMMQPSSMPTADAVNGNISSVSSEGGMGESLSTEHDVKTIDQENISLAESKRNNTSEGSPSDEITLHYTDFDVEVPVDNTYRGYGEEPEYKEVRIEWDYHPDVDVVIEELMHIPEVQEEYKDLSDEEYYNTIVNNLDTLVSKYYAKLHNMFYDEAFEDAIDNYVQPEKQSYYDAYDDYVDNKMTRKLDDDFDMSMRTLL